jgi:hypothetical protein
MGCGEAKGKYKDDLEFEIDEEALVQGFLKLNLEKEIENELLELDLDMQYMNFL